MTTTEKTYEMMWDCAFCGKKKLLGKTHRHCPNCGAPQDPEKRYFPPDDEKVAVEDHEYAGADVMCPSCGFANGRAANNCGNCGGPLGGAKDAAVQQELVVPDGGAPAAAAPAPGAPGQEKGKSKTGCIIGAVALGVVALIAIIVVATCWKKEAAFEVAGHSWTREIPIERYDSVKEKKDCKDMPSGAKNVKRSKGEKVCKTRKVDKGDGTYKEKRECSTPKETCEYSVLKWDVTRTEKATGGLDDAPKWPSVTLHKKGNCEGCEREGKRTETYSVKFKDTASNETKSCDFSDKSKWQSFEKGSKWKGKVRMVGGGIDCSSLRAGG